jgi:hypothetical protein
MKWLLVLLLSGCTVLSTHKTEGWPKLSVAEHYVSRAEILARCDGYQPKGMDIWACSIIYLCKRTCDIYVPEDGSHLEHERGHCEGHDHVGSDVFERLIKEKC